MTKEEIWKNKRAVYPAMDEYAKQEAIGFLDFLNNNDVLTLKDGIYWIGNEMIAYPHEADILYSLYLKQKQK